MTIDVFSRRALLEAKKEGDVYAPRQKVWPPKGYVPPTVGEFAELVRAARRYADGWTFRAQWERMTDDTVIRQVQLVEILRGDDARTKAVYDYAHELRREMSRRGLVHRSIAVLRCEGCSHASERLFEATQTTHPGMVNRSGDTVDSAWFCARCWSGDNSDGEDED